MSKNSLKRRKSRRKNSLRRKGSLKKNNMKKIRLSRNKKKSTKRNILRRKRTLKKRIKGGESVMKSGYSPLSTDHPILRREQMVKFINLTGNVITIQSVKRNIRDKLGRALRKDWVNINKLVSTDSFIEELTADGEIWRVKLSTGGFLSPEIKGNKNQIITIYYGATYNTFGSEKDTNVYSCDVEVLDDYPYFEDQIIKVGDNQSNMVEAKVFRYSNDKLGAVIQPGVRGLTKWTGYVKNIPRLTREEKKNMIDNSAKLLSEWKVKQAFIEDIGDHTMQILNDSGEKIAIQFFSKKRGEWKDNDDEMGVKERKNFKLYKDLSGEYDGMYWRAVHPQNKDIVLTTWECPTIIEGSILKIMKGFSSATINLKSEKQFLGTPEDNLGMGMIAYNRLAVNFNRDNTFGGNITWDICVTAEWNHINSKVSRDTFFSVMYKNQSNSQSPTGKNHMVLSSKTWEYLCDKNEELENLEIADNYKSKTQDINHENIIKKCIAIMDLIFVDPGENISRSLKLGETPTSFPRSVANYDQELIYKGNMFNRDKLVQQLEIKAKVEATVTTPVTKYSVNLYSNYNGMFRLEKVPLWGMLWDHIKAKYQTQLEGENYNEELIYNIFRRCLALDRIFYSQPTLLAPRLCLQKIGIYGDYKVHYSFSNTKLVFTNKSNESITFQYKKGTKWTPLQQLIDPGESYTITKNVYHNQMWRVNSDEHTYMLTLNNLGYIGELEHVVDIYDKYSEDQRNMGPPSSRSSLTSSIEKRNSDDRKSYLIIVNNSSKSVRLYGWNVYNNKHKIFDVSARKKSVRWNITHSICGIQIAEETENFDSYWSMEKGYTHTVTVRDMKLVASLQSSGGHSKTGNNVRMSMENTTEQKLDIYYQWEGIWKKSITLGPKQSYIMITTTGAAWHAENEEGDMCEWRLEKSHGDSPKVILSSGDTASTQLLAEDTRTAPGVSARDTRDVPGASARDKVASPGVSARDKVASPGVSARDTRTVPGASARNTGAAPEVSARDTSEVTNHPLTERENEKLESFSRDEDKPSWYSKSLVCNEDAMSLWLKRERHAKNITYVNNILNDKGKTIYSIKISDGDLFFHVAFSYSSFKKIVEKANALIDFKGKIIRGTKGHDSTHTIYEQCIERITMIDTFFRNIISVMNQRDFQVEYKRNILNHITSL